jgi:hypothetical protein
MVLAVDWLPMGDRRVTSQQDYHEITVRKLGKKIGALSDPDLVTPPGQALRNQFFTGFALGHHLSLHHVAQSR